MLQKSLFYTLKNTQEDFLEKKTTWLQTWQIVHLVSLASNDDSMKMFVKGIEIYFDENITGDK